MATGEELRRLTGHRAQVAAVAVSSDGSQIASNDDSGEIRLWGSDKLQPNGILFNVPTQQLQRIALSSDGQYALIQATSHVYLVHMNPFQLIQDMADANVSSFYSNVNTVAVVNLGDASTKIRILDGSSGKLINAFDIPVPPEAANGTYFDLQLSPDGKLVALFGIYRHQVIIYNSATGQPVQTLKDLSNWPVYASFSADSKTLLIGQWDGDLKLWSVESGQSLVTYPGKGTGAIFSARFSPDGTQVLADWNNAPTSLFDRDSGRLLRTLPNGFQQSDFSADGRFVALPAYGAPMAIWDTVTGQEVRQFTEDSNSVVIAFSKDGKSLYTGGFDGTLRQWDVSIDGLLATSCNRIFHDFDLTDYSTFAIAKTTATCPNLAATAPIWRAITGTWYSSQVPESWMGFFNATLDHIIYGKYGYVSPTSSISDFLPIGFSGTPDTLLTTLKADPSWNNAVITTSTQTINGVAWTLYHAVLPAGNTQVVAATEHNGLTYSITFSSPTAQFDQDYQQIYLPILNTIKLSFPNTGAAQTF